METEILFSCWVMISTVKTLQWLSSGALTSAANVYMHQLTCDGQCAAGWCGVVAPRPPSHLHALEPASMATCAAPKPGPLPSWGESSKSVPLKPPIGPIGMK